MTKPHDTVLVVDVEATCWPGGPPPDEQSEIIEIGWCLLDAADGDIVRNGTQLVRPQRSKVSEFCTALTTLTPEMVAGGVPFHEACAFLADELESRGLSWASYGEYDRKQFARQCESFGVPYPFGESHINVKAMFAEVKGLPRPVGMASALRILDLPLEGTHHRGGDDACNIAAILASVIGPPKRGEQP